MKKKQSSKMPTSKKLTWIIVCAYYITQILAALTLTFLDKDLSGLLEYQKPLILCVVISYFGKAGAENVVDKIFKPKTGENQSETEYNGN